MKFANRMIARRRALAVTTLFVAALPLFAVAAPQSESPGEMSAEKLEAVARAYIKVYEVQQSYKPKIEAATGEEANQLQQAANQEMVEVIQDVENVTVNEYNDVIQALGDDDELRDRLQDQVNKIQEEESEK